MNFNQHYELKGLHSVFSPSKYHWINYDNEKIISSYINSKAVEIGVKKHELAATLIELGQKLPRTNQTLNMYVNDAIGYRMTPEQPLYYSEYFFGTADSICFRKERGINKLRIHDYKSGTTPAHMEQLIIYAALFCLEYKIKPVEIEMELRIYQMDDVIIFNPTVEDIAPVMDKIVTFTKILSKYNSEQGG